MRHSFGVFWSGDRLDAPSTSNPTTTHPHDNTEGKPLTSPKTNLEAVSPEDARLVPNVHARGLVLEYEEAKTREWEAAERRWREAGVGV